MYRDTQFEKYLFLLFGFRILESLHILKNKPKINASRIAMTPGANYFFRQVSDSALSALAADHPSLEFHHSPLDIRMFGHNS